MRKIPGTPLALACVTLLLSHAAAQPPTGRPGDDAKDKAKDYSNAPLVVRMMAFDKKKDGKLTRDEVTDERLLRLFDQADADKDGVVTKEELMALAAKLDAENVGGERRGPRGPGDQPPGRDGPPPPRGDREPPGPGNQDNPPGPGPGRFGPPRPGQVLPAFLQDSLKLTADQKKQLDELQKDVDTRLDKILTADQKQQLKEMRPGRGPGGRDGPPPGPPPGDPNRQGQDRDRPNPDR